MARSKFDVGISCANKISSKRFYILAYVIAAVVE